MDGSSKIWFLIAPVILLPMQGCIEPFDTSYVDFESTIVIDATITDEPKHQEIYISRTYEFEADGPTGESAAKVQVLAGNGNTYDFAEEEIGTYVSNQIFSAEPNMDYTLEVTTKDGKSYVSTAVQMKGKSSLDSLYAIRMVNDFGEDGMGVFVDASSSGDGPGYYRYEYEETYKVVAPLFRNDDLAVVDQTPPLPSYLIKVPRPSEERVCYPTHNSTQLILKDTESLDVDRFTNFNVRFISRENYIITHRYSILVRQYSQSVAANTFFEMLRNFSSSESLFSQVQPGYFSGNISSTKNPEEKVLGHFDVSSVAEKRIFFNFEDYFPDERLPPYVNVCEPTSIRDGNLIGLVRTDSVKYLKDWDGEDFYRHGTYIHVTRVCGDCTVLGPSEAPEFWIE